MHWIRTLLILTALCLSAITFASCGGGDEDAQQTLENATFKGVESAAFNASLEIESKGSPKADVVVDLSGQAQAEGTEINAKVDGTVQGKPLSLEGGLTLFDNHGFLRYQGTAYEIEPNNYSIAKPLFFPALAEKGGAEIRDCKQAASEIQIGDLLNNLSSDGNVEVAGTETTKVSGELDVPTAVKAFVNLAEDSACSTQFEALSPFAFYKVRLLGDELATSVEQSAVQVYVGDDDIIRKFSAELGGNPSAGDQPVTIRFELALSEINSNRKIKVPSKPQSIFAFLGKLGVSPFEFLSWRRGGEGVRTLGERVAAETFP